MVHINSVALFNAQRGKKMFVFLLKYIQDVTTSKTYNYGGKNAKKKKLELKQGPLDQKLKTLPIHHIGNLLN